MIIGLERIFQQILNMSLMASYCIAAVFLLRWLFRKAPKRYTYLLWIVVAFRLLCPLSIESAFSIFNLKLVPEVVIEEQLGQSDVQQEVNSAEQDALIDLPGQSGQQIGMNSGRVNQPGENLSGTIGQPSEGELSEILQPTVLQPSDPEPITWIVIAPWIWIGGMTVLAGLMLISWVQLKLHVRTAIRLRDNIYETDGIESPFVMGVIRPRIYLPIGLGEQEQLWILLHENCHIRRRDHLVKILASLFTIVHWFNPLVWAAWYGFCRDMEMSCDEIALEGADAQMRKGYSRTLLAVASDRHFRWQMPPAFGENDVESRVKHVLSFRKPAVWAGGAFVVVLVAVAVIFGTNGRNEVPDETLPGVEISGERTAGTEKNDKHWDYDSVEGDAWIVLAWDAFANQTEIDWDCVGNESSMAYGYTGFLDCHPLKDGYPLLGVDYDGDGLKDRVFQRYIQEEGRYEIYLFFGDGELLKLENRQLLYSRVSGADLTGDGQREIVYINRMVGADNNGASYLSIYTKSDGAWSRMETPFEEEGYPASEKDPENRTWAKYWSEEFMMNTEGEESPQLKAVGSVEVSVLPDRNTGYSKLRICGDVGSFRKPEYVAWDVWYETGEWKSKGYADSQGFDQGGNWYLDRRTETALKNYPSVEALLNASKSRDGLGLAGLILRLRGEAIITLGDVTIIGLCDLAELDERGSVTVFVQTVSGAEGIEIPNTIVLTQQVESVNDECYFTMDYLGETLYWGRYVNWAEIDITTYYFDLSDKVYRDREDQLLYWDLVFSEAEWSRFAHRPARFKDSYFFNKFPTKTESVYQIHDNSGSMYVRLQEEVVDGEKTGRWEMVDVQTGERVRRVLPEQ